MAIKKNVIDNNKQPQEDLKEFKYKPIDSIIVPGREIDIIDDEDVKKPIKSRKKNDPIEEYRPLGGDDEPGLDLLRPNPNKGPLINTWKPKPSQMICMSDGKLFIMNFEKIFDLTDKYTIDVPDTQENRDRLNVYNKFLIKKTSYEKQLPSICKYLNYFMNYYDKKGELILAYSKLKYLIDRTDEYGPDNIDKFIDRIYSTIFTPSLINNVCQMIEDNYQVDIENGTTPKKVYNNKDRPYRENLEFTNRHVKILLRISLGIKMIAPVLFHFSAINNIKHTKDSDMIYRFYRNLFNIFSFGVDMYNKLYVYVKTKVYESEAHNRVIYDQRDITGSDVSTLIQHFLCKVLITENIVKYEINHNIIGFNKTIIKFQLMYYIREQYSKTLTEVTNIKNSDGLSGFDKMEMNLGKKDEGLIVFSQLCSNDAVRQILKDNDFGISMEELEWYKKYHKPSKIQAQLVQAYWIKYFGSSRNFMSLTREQYITIMLVMQKKLLFGCKVDKSTVMLNFPFFLSGNLLDKPSARVIRNTKFMTKIKESYAYNKIINDKYKYANMIEPDYIIQIISIFINSPMSYVIYGRDDLLNDEIVFDEDKLAEEILFFISNL